MANKKMNRIQVWWNLTLEKIKYAYTRTKVPVYFLAIVALSIVLYLIGHYKWQSIKAIFDDATLVGVLGTLLGAVVGGIMSLFGSVWVSRQQIKASTMMRRKESIYVPLYNELSEIHNRILVDAPYPTYIVFHKQTQTIRAHPQYAVLSQIKNDVRRLEIPAKLWILIERLENEVIEYQKLIHCAENSVAAHLNEVLKQELQVSCTVVNIGSVLLSNVVSENSFNLFEEMFGGFTPHKEVDLMHQKEIQRIFVSNCKKDGHIQALKERYGTWIQTQKDVLDLLEVMIKNINSSYEE